MLEMSGGFSVTRTDAPTVSPQIDVSFAHRYHRFDSNTHTRLQHDAVTTTSIVGHRRIFVHLTSDTMTCKFSDHTIAFSLAIVLYGSTNISHVLACHGILNAFKKRFPGYLK